MTETVSNTQVLLARLAVVLVIGFVIAGVSWYGISTDTLERVWQNLADRPGGPMTFRIILQPTMAAIAAVVDGTKDAKSGRSPYLWTILTDPSKRSQRMLEGLISTARIILLGLSMDVIYQLVVLKTFFPAEAAFVAIMLAFVPYLLLRGPVARIVRWWGSDLRPDKIQ